MTGETLPTIAIVDYGMGNLRSVEKGFERVGYRAQITRETAVIGEAEGVVLPGVGAFGACMDNLKRLDLVGAVCDAIDSGRPFLGICVGMQLLFEESEEYGPVAGLGVLAGRCRRFRASDDREYRVPHMGWNRLSLQVSSPLLCDVEDGSFVYFVHSYYAESDDPAVVAATTPYGVDVVASVAKGNLFGCQFHPEKSQAVGLKILSNFGALAAGRYPLTGGGDADAQGSGSC